MEEDDRGGLGARALLVPKAEADDVGSDNEDGDDSHVDSEDVEATLNMCFIPRPQAVCHILTISLPKRSVSAIS